MPHVRDQAIVLRHWEYSETSQTVALFTREHGAVRGLAKGARRDRGSFSGGFEALTYGELCAIVKPTTELSTLTEWDLQEVFWAARRDLQAHRAGLYIVDLLHHMLNGPDPHQVLFDEALAALRGLSESAAIGERVLHFQWVLLSETGYRPRLALQGSAVAEKGAGTVHHFSARGGGLVPAPPAGGEDTWKVRGDTIAVLRRLEGGDSFATSRMAPEQVFRASRLLGAYLSALMERELTTHGTYFEAAGSENGGQGKPVKVPDS